MYEYSAGRLSHNLVVGTMVEYMCYPPSSKVEAFKKGLDTYGISVKCQGSKAIASETVGLKVFTAYRL